MSIARMALLALGCFVYVLPVHASWITPFISEIHYDNAGGDIGEFVALTGESGSDLSGWQIVLYNGSNGMSYNTLFLDGQFDGAGAWSERVWSATGIQNGPDALALVAPDAGVVEFLAYEGTFVAANGPANGLTATLLPLAEGSSTPVGWSLQRTGGADEFTWIAGPQTSGLVNEGLALAAATVDAPGAAASSLAAMLGWWMVVAMRRQRPAPRLAVA